MVENFKRIAACPFTSATSSEQNLNALKTLSGRNVVLTMHFVPPA